MKSIYTPRVATVAALTALALVVSCDWSGGSGNDFNTSGGSAISNVSGFYQGVQGKRAVASTSRGNINSLTVQQSGNRVDVVDNQGSKYVGTVGAPLVSGVVSNGEIPQGALVASYQISWTGKDGVAALDIEFTGTINLVTLTDIQGTTSANTNGSTSNNGTSTTSQTITSIVNPGQSGIDGVEPGSTNVVTTTTNSGVAKTASKTTTTTVTYQLTDASTQFRLRGTWVEKGGKVSSVDAVAAGVFGNLSQVLAGP